MAGPTRGLRVHRPRNLMSLLGLIVARILEADERTIGAIARYILGIWYRSNTPRFDCTEDSGELVGLPARARAGKRRIGVKR